MAAKRDTRFYGTDYEIPNGSRTVKIDKELALKIGIISKIVRAPASVVLSAIVRDQLPNVYINDVPADEYIKGHMETALRRKAARRDDDEQ